MYHLKIGIKSIKPQNSNFNDGTDLNLSKMSIIKGKIIECLKQYIKFIVTILSY